MITNLKIDNYKSLTESTELVLIQYYKTRLVLGFKPLHTQIAAELMEIIEWDPGVGGWTESSGRMVKWQSVVVC